MEYSKYQLDIFEEIKSGVGNLLIEACAGSGHPEHDRHGGARGAADGVPQVSGRHGTVLSSGSGREDRDHGRQRHDQRGRHARRALRRDTRLRAGHAGGAG